MEEFGTSWWPQAAGQDRLQHCNLASTDLGRTILKFTPPGFEKGASDGQVYAFFHALTKVVSRGLLPKPFGRSVFNFLQHLRLNFLIKGAVDPTRWGCPKLCKGSGETKEV